MMKHFPSHDTLVILLAVCLLAVLFPGCARQHSSDAVPFLLYVQRSLPGDAPSPEYVAVPATWDLHNNAVSMTDHAVAHIDGKLVEYPLSWSLQGGGSALLLQIWSISTGKQLVTATSRDAAILVPPAQECTVPGVPAEESICRWYAAGEHVFLVLSHEHVAGQNARNLVVTQYAMVSRTARSLIVPVPASFKTSYQVFYAAGSLADGYVLVQNVASSTGETAVWLLRLQDGRADWIRCRNPSHIVLSMSGQSPVLARVGSLVYYTHGREGICCIDTRSDGGHVPTVSVTGDINSWMTYLYRHGPVDTEGPVQALLESSGKFLIVGYPDATWNYSYYAFDAEGNKVGMLDENGATLTPFDGEGNRGTPVRQRATRVGTIRYDATEGGILPGSFPCGDFFELNNVASVRNVFGAGAGEKHQRLKTVKGTGQG